MDEPKRIIYSITREHYRHHDWQRTEDGSIDDMAFDVDFHNGPMCQRCGYSFCIHCEDDNVETLLESECINERRKKLCPYCMNHISSLTLDTGRMMYYCPYCGKEIDYQDEDVITTNMYFDENGNMTEICTTAGKEVNNG